MAGLHPRAMQPRDESAHRVVEDALERGYLDTGAEYPVDGFTTHSAANAGRLAVNRAGQHLGVSTACWVVDSDGRPCYRQCQNENSPHGIRFRLHSKNKARAHVVQETGGDPAQLKFNPFARKNQRLIDDDGQRIRA